MVQTYRMGKLEQSAAMETLHRHRGKAMAHGFKVGDRVAYRGISYTLYDHTAMGSDSEPILLSDKFDVIHGVQWSDLKPSTV